LSDGLNYLVTHIKLIGEEKYQKQVAQIISIAA